jgi:amino-acid N-acetyltransferase
MTRSLDAATAEDFSAVEALLRKAALSIEGLRDHFPNGYVIARSAGKIVGVAGLEAYGFVGILRSVFVTEEARNQGVGRDLVQDRINAARRGRLAAVYLMTTAAAPFFRALGFADTDRGAAPRALLAAPEFSRGAPASSTCLMLMIE